MADNEDETDSAEDEGDDVAYKPGSSADSLESIKLHISPDVLKFYEVYSYKHAATILSVSFPQELADIEAALLNFKLTKKIIGTLGGNESQVPKMLSGQLRPKGWQEARIQGDLLVRMQRYEDQVTGGKIKKVKLAADPPKLIENFIDGHKIDYVKGRVAFDLEWNSKDQTFDRDLYAMRAFHETGLISAGVMLTRGLSLGEAFEKIPQLDKSGNIIKQSVKAKYGASTTWMGKLLYRLNAGRHGACPILAFGIKPTVIVE